LDVTFNCPLLMAFDIYHTAVNIDEKLAQIAHFYIECGALIKMLFFD
jgi:hypothetical protein